MEKQAEFFFFILINVNFNLQIEIGCKGGEKSPWKLEGLSNYLNIYQKSVRRRAWKSSSI